MVLSVLKAAVFTLGLRAAAGARTERADRGEGLELQARGAEALAVLPERFSFEWGQCSPQVVQDGYAYFEQVAESFRSAEKEVIIMGWWTHWNVALFRDPANPTADGRPTLTITDLIREAAQRGVHVYVLFWKSSVSEGQGYAISADAEALDGLSDNVHVLLDNSREVGPVLFWSAHIKVTIFDRSRAFAGGIDFALTRLDTPEHLLPDPRRARDESNEKGGQHGYGKPWQDVMVRVSGGSARDLALVATERWMSFCDQTFLSKPAACEKQNLLSAQADDDFGRVEVALSALDPSAPWKGAFLTVHPEGMRSKDDTRVDLREQGKGSVDLGGRRDFGRRAAVSLQVKARKVSDSIWFFDSDEELLSRSIPLEEIRGHGEMTLSFEAYNAKVTLTHVSSRPSHYEGDHSCRILLTGDERWLGSSEKIEDIYAEHLNMIKGAESSIYIENQYFNSWERGDGRCEEEGGLFDGPLHPDNVISGAIFDKIVAMAEAGTPFSVAVVEPLATEEPETQYPNLRAAKCLHRKLTQHWEARAKAGKALPSLEDYFGIFHLANVVEHGGQSYFYGIFVHSKLIVVDHGVPTAEAIVGSANINDRSMLGDRDAEVSVAVKGAGFSASLVQDLLAYHLGEASRGEPAAVVQEMRQAAAHNVEVLRSYGVDWAAGTWGAGTGEEGTKAIFDQKRGAKFNEAEAYKVGSGVHWAPLPPTSASPRPVFKGHLLPWSAAAWGTPWQYRSWKHVVDAAWVQADGATVPIQKHE